MRVSSLRFTDGRYSYSRRITSETSAVRPSMDIGQLGVSESQRCSPVQASTMSRGATILAADCTLLCDDAPSVDNSTTAEFDGYAEPDEPDIFSRMSGTPELSRSSSLTRQSSHERRSELPDLLAPYRNSQVDPQDYHAHFEQGRSMDASAGIRKALGETDGTSLLTRSFESSPSTGMHTQHRVSSSTYESPAGRTLLRDSGRDFRSRAEESIEDAMPQFKAVNPEGNMYHDTGRVNGNSWHSSAYSQATMHCDFSLRHCANTEAGPSKISTSYAAVGHHQLAGHSRKRKRMVDNEGESTLSTSLASTSYAGPSITAASPTACHMAKKVKLEDGDRSDTPPQADDPPHVHCQLMVKGECCNVRVLAIKTEVRAHYKSTHSRKALEKAARERDGASGQVVVMAPAKKCGKIFCQWKGCTSKKQIGEGTMARHVAGHFGCRFPCAGCAKSYSREDAADRHMDACENHPCKRCGDRFPSKEARDEHLALCKGVVDADDADEA